MTISGSDLSNCLAGLAKRKALILLLGTFLASMAVLPAASADRAWTDCAQAGDADRSISGCTAVLGRGSREPNASRARAFHWRGKAYYAKGDHDSAIADFDQVVRLDSRNAIALSNRGLALHAKGELARAISDYTEAIRLDPKNGTTFHSRADTYRLQGDFHRAIADFNEAIRLNPKDPWVFNNRGLAYAARGEHERAIADYSQSTNTDPSPVPGLVNRGLAHEQMGAPQLARLDFALALAYKTSRPGPEWAMKIARERLSFLNAQENRTENAPIAQAPVPLPSSGQAQLTKSAARRVALVIGNDRYGSLSPLRNAVADARAVADALKSLDFRVIRGEDLGYRAANRLHAEFEAAIGPGDTAFVFFAGHGIAIGGENYLLPTDVEKPAESQENLVRSEAHSLDELIRRVQGRGARTSLFVIDACRDNPFAAAGVRSVGSTRGLTRVDAPTGVFVLFSAGTGQSALDRLGEADTSPYSVFTRTLIPLLGQPGISHLALAKRVQTEVKALASTVRHAQHPAFYDQIDGEVVLKPGPTADARPQPPKGISEQGENPICMECYLLDRS